jgi:hypothetical protein
MGRMRPSWPVRRPPVRNQQRQADSGRSGSGGAPSTRFGGWRRRISQGFGCNFPFYCGALYVSLNAKVFFRKKKSPSISLQPQAPLPYYSHCDDCFPSLLSSYELFAIEHNQCFSVSCCIGTISDAPLAWHIWSVEGSKRAPSPSPKKKGHWVIKWLILSSFVLHKAQQLQSPVIVWIWLLCFLLDFLFQS